LVCAGIQATPVVECTVQLAWHTPLKEEELGY